MSTMASQITINLTIRAEASAYWQQENINLHIADRLGWESTNDCWIPLTKGQ